MPEAGTAALESMVPMHLGESAFRLALNELKAAR